jgi:hypothetical protein
LVTTLGILGNAVTGTAGAVLTLSIGAGFAPLAFAELALALVAAVLIAVCGRSGPRRKQSKRRKDSLVPAPPGPKPP